MSSLTFFANKAEATQAVKAQVAKRSIICHFVFAVEVIKSVGFDIGFVVQVTPLGVRVPAQNFSTSADIDAFVAAVQAGTAPGPVVHMDPAVAVAEFRAQMAAAQSS